jgi:type IV secretory pathway VirB3-like protein
LAPTANSSVPLKVYQGDVLPFTISATDRDFQQYLTLRMFLPVADKIYFSNALTTAAPLSPASSFIAAQNISRFNIEYRPDPSYFGLAGVSYFANDADNLNSTLDTVFLEVVHVNHQPVAYGFDVYTLENNVDQANVVTRISNQFVFSDFDGSYDEYSLVILSLPARGSLSKQDLSAVVVGEPIPQASSAFTVLFTPVVNTFDTTGVYSSFTFQICDNSMNATTNCSLVQTANIFVGPVNHPPSSASLNVTLLQNSNTSFTISGVDTDTWDSNDADVKLIVISSTGLGEFFTDAAFSVPLQLSAAVYPRTLAYRPPRNIASPAPDVPLATLRFRVVDDNTTFSGIYDVNFYVTPILQPPEYKGDARLAVPENVATSFLLASTVFFNNYNQGFQFRYDATVVTLPARGSLAVCDPDDICTDVSINGVPVNASVTSYPITHPDGKIIFTGDKDTFGDSYAYLVFTVTDNLGQTATVNVTFDVTHINQKPKIVDYTWSDSSIILNENDTAIIKFKVVDVDSPPANLRLRFSSRSVARYAWTLSSCSDNATAAPCAISSEVATKDSPARNINPNVTAVLVNSCDVPEGYPVTDFGGCGRFYVMQFSPAQRTYSYQYAQFTFTVSDDEGLESEPQLIYVVVLPINDAPSIQAPSRITGSNGATLVRLVDSQTNQRIVVDDFDSTRGSELLLDIEYVSGLDGEFVTSGNATGNCRLNETAAAEGKDVWRCTGTLNSLNAMLASASWNFNPSGTAESSDEITTLKLTLNDQGSTSVDNNDPKEATATVVVAYTRPASVITVPPANNWATIVAIIVALLLLAIIAGVLYRLRKSLKTPNDDYFSLGTSAIATAPENPLFKAATKEGFNKLFKAKGADEDDVSADASYSDS